MSTLERVLSGIDAIGSIAMIKGGVLPKSNTIKTLSESAERDISLINNDILNENRIGWGASENKKWNIENYEKGSGNKLDKTTPLAVKIDGSPLPIQPKKIENGITYYSEIKDKSNASYYAHQEYPGTAIQHGFNDIVDNYAGYAIKTDLKNGSTLYQLEGGYQNMPGRFEWIIDPNLGGVSHRMFVPNGSLNGVPQKP